MEVEKNDSVINSFIIEGLSNKTPLIDIFVLLTNELKGIKKITVAHHPINYISDFCKCQVDFINYEYFSLAKSILKSPKPLNNIFNQNNIKIIECKKNRNNLIDESVNQTTALMFENMQIDHINIMEFILYLKQYIILNNIDENNNYKISKIRQYNNRILIIFDYIPNCIKKLIRKGENEYLDDISYYNYKGKNVPIIPKMKPITNLGKYKEKNVKISIHCLNQEDKEHLFSIFDKNNEKIINKNYMIGKMAEKAYNNINNKDKNNREEKLKKGSINRKREREKDKINDREKEKDRNRERNTDKSKDRKRDKDRKKDRDYERRNQNERDEYSIDRKNDNNNDYKNNLRNDNNNINNSLNNINNNINGLKINEKDLNQVASLFSNSNAMNLVKYLIENNIFNNISNNNNIDNNNDLMQKKLKIKQNDDNSLKNNFNDVFNNMFNPNNLNNNINNQQLLNLIQSQGNFKNQQQRMNNILGNNLNNNYQNMMNMNAMMNIDNNLLNNNYFNNTRQFPFNMNDQYINQFGYNQQKRKDNNK